MVVISVDLILVGVVFGCFLRYSVFRFVIWGEVIDVLDRMLKVGFLFGVFLVVVRIVMLGVVIFGFIILLLLVSIGLWFENLVICGVGVVIFVVFLLMRVMG